MPTIPVIGGGGGLALAEIAQQLVFMDHFRPDTNTLPSWRWTQVIGSGGGVDRDQLHPARWGVWGCRAGATSYRGIQLGTTAGNRFAWAPGSGTMYWEVHVHMADSRNTADLGRAYIGLAGPGGFTSATYNAAPTDYIGFFADGADTVWHARCSSSGTATEADDGATQAALDTWYKLGWWYDATAGSVQFAVDDTKVAEVATNIPTSAQGLIPVHRVWSQPTATTLTIWSVDLMWGAIGMTAPSWVT